MKLYLTGHDRKYAAEQMLLTLFPGERPEYPDTPPRPEDPSAQICAQREYGSGELLRVETRLHWGGRDWTGTWTGPLAGTAEEREWTLRHGVRLSFYQAGVQALGKEPPWGALTGVRPVKLPTRDMKRGLTRTEAGQRLEQIYRVSHRRAELALDCAQASLAAQAALNEHEVSLYVGIPFCPTRCAYCSFVSAGVGRTLKLVEPFLEALEREIAAAGRALAQAGRQVRTVYIGGGTPTTLSAPQLDRLMGTLAEHIDLSACTEYTVEAGRPDTITAEKLDVLCRRGAGRVSVNPQSMDDRVLSAMGRAHRAEDIVNAYTLVRERGIPCVNMDLIAGLPADSPAGFQSSLEQVLTLGPENITVHTLALKKGSQLMNGTQEGPALPSGEAVAGMLDYAWDALAAAGQRPYYLYRQKYMSGSFENVGWTRPGFEGIYNICMMEELHTIVSLGGGGVTKLVDARRGRIQRLTNAKYPQEYLRDIDKALADKEKLLSFYSQG